MADSDVFILNPDLYCYRLRLNILDGIKDFSRRAAVEALFAREDSIDSILSRHNRSFTVIEHSLIRAIQLYLRFVTAPSIDNLSILSQSIQGLWALDSSVALQLLQGIRFPSLYGSVSGIPASNPIHNEVALRRVDDLMAQFSPLFTFLRQPPTGSHFSHHESGCHQAGKRDIEGIQKMRIERISGVLGDSCTQDDLSIIDDPILFSWHVEFLYHISQGRSPFSSDAALRMKDIISHALRDSELLGLALVVLCNDEASRIEQNKIRDLSAIHKLRIYGNPCGPADTHFLSRELLSTPFSKSDPVSRQLTAVCISGQARGFMSTLPRLIDSVSRSLDLPPFVSVATWSNPGVNIVDHGSQLFRHFPPQLYGSITAKLLRKHFPEALDTLAQLDSSVSVSADIAHILESLVDSGLISGYALKVTDEKDLETDFQDRQHEIFVKFFYNFCASIDNLANYELRHGLNFHSVMWSRPDLNVFLKSMPRMYPDVVYATTCSWPFGLTDFLLMGDKSLFLGLADRFRGLDDLSQIQRMFGYTSIPLALGKYFYSKGISCYSLSDDCLQQEGPLLKAFSFDPGYICTLFEDVFANKPHLKDLPELSSFYNGLDQLRHQLTRQK